MQRAHQIRPIVHGDVWGMVKGSLDVLVIGDVVLTFDSKGGHFVNVNQGSRHIVLGGEGI